MINCKEVKSNVRDGITFKLTQELIKTPRCHDHERYQIVRVITCNDGEVIERPLVEFRETGSPKLFGDDKYNVIYYSDNAQKLEVLDALKRGSEDQFDTCPPTKEWYNIIDKITELENLIHNAR